MGSGSSRSGRALRRLRSPDSRPAGPDGAAPEGGTGLPVSATAAAAREEAREAAAEAAEGAAGPGPGPAVPPDGGDETLRLLDQLLAESAAWGPGELAPRGPARPRPAAGAGSPPVFRKTRGGRRAEEERRRRGKQGAQVGDSAEIQLWFGLFKASLRSPVMTHHTLILSSAGFPRPQPRRHGLPGVQMCPTYREWQASCWLGACVCTRPGAATRGCCVFAFHKLLSCFSKLDLLGGLSNTFCI
ncbi:cystin-1 isoform X1 [Eubalaena glacialis]|uniref:cystin-1 isoform X1 n=1 Tax=Eubalaena glacialis TaxID=27606 RepID=UPI002A5A2424|nr:cystin-1 isoform X1 [Eubalaena glacialis]